jgi:Pyruvate/2-oxoacid:ferredoxin oxidoreductase delta subunit
VLLFWHHKFQASTETIPDSPMATPLWFVHMIKRSFPLRFSIAKWTRIPILGKCINYALFHKDRLFYLPKHEVLNVNVPLNPIHQVLPTDILRHFINRTNRFWIMNKCICRDSMQCQHYPTDLGCLFLGEASQKINPAMGRSVNREEAWDHVLKCQAEGLVHLIGRNKLDTLWLGVGPGNKLLTICHCCPCCCLWKILPDLNDSVSRHVTGLRGVNVKVNDDCSGCKNCMDICFVNAIQLINNKAFITNDCRGCGRCVLNCPTNSISLTIEMNAAETSISSISILVEI